MTRNHHSGCTCIRCDSQMNPDDYQPCTTCNGTGSVLRQRMPQTSSASSLIRCPTCMGERIVPKGKGQSQNSAQTLSNHTPSIDWDGLLSSLTPPVPPRTAANSPGPARFKPATSWWERGGAPTTGARPAKTPVARANYSKAQPSHKTRHWPKRRFKALFNKFRRSARFLVVIGVLSVISLSHSPSQLLNDLMYIVEEKSLPPASFRAGVACSGSMEPAITCLDEVTIVTDFNPDEVGSGMVIMFESPADGAAILHRVLHAKQESGEYFYRTVGDANPVPDDWWVSESMVTGYVSEVHKNVRMENSHKRIQGIAERNRKFGY